MLRAGARRADARRVDDHRAAELRVHPRPLGDQPRRRDLPIETARISGDTRDALVRRVLQGYLHVVHTGFHEGVGDVGADIFLREVQVAWTEVAPFADERALGAARDLGLPDGTGIDIVSTLREKIPDARSIVLTSFDDDYALAAALHAGAKAYLLKTVRGAEIAEVVKAVAAGRTLLDERTVTRRRADHDDPTADLTPSERKVLELIGDGLSNREIGEKLGVAEKTVKNHITALLSKMGLQRRTQVAAWVAGQRAAGWRH